MAKMYRRNSATRVTNWVFDATPTSPDSQIEAELARHPVLRLIPRP